MLSNLISEMSKSVKLNAIKSPRKTRATKRVATANLTAETSEFFDSKKVPEEKKKKRAPVKIQSDEAPKENWCPENWRATLENIRTMRKNRTAPVDDMGCHKCADPEDTPSNFRFQSLVALMLSSQTKDQVTHAAMKRLVAHGCTPEKIKDISDETLGELIYPVGFWKVCIFNLNYIENIHFLNNFKRYQ